MNSEYVNTDYLYRGSARFHPRALLTAEQAMEIYSDRIPSFRGKIVMQAKKYNVSPKTIRDILNRRTWAKETRHLWAQDEQASIRAQKAKASPRPVRASSMYHTNGAAPAALARGFAYQSLDDRGSSTAAQWDDMSNSEPNLPRTSSSAVTTVTPPYPANLHLAPPAEPMSSAPQPDLYDAAWPPALFLPEEFHLGSEQAGTSDDPFHFDWPNW
jgi:hypothetical protein